MRGSIQKKRSNYYVVLPIFDKSTGKRRQKWIPAGKRKKDAEILLAETVGDVHNGTYREIKKILFWDFGVLWLKTYPRIKVKPSTYASYSRTVHNQLIPKFGDHYLNTISTDMLQRFFVNRMDNVKPKTIINEIVVTKLMFKHASRWGYLKINPAEYLERPKVEHEEMDFLTPDEIAVFLENADPKYKIFFLTAILTGMRRGELLGLQWCNIDFNSNQIHVKRSMWDGKFTTPKTKYSIRKIDMTPLLSLELKKYKFICPKGELDLVFPNSDGKPMDPNNMIKRHYIPALRRAKLRWVRFHNLRHTNVALRIEQNQNIKYIQRQLGHSSIQTTLDRYGHLIKEASPDEARKLDIALKTVRN